MNPSSTPWSTRQKEVEPEPEDLSVPTAPPYLGLRATKAKESKSAKHFLSIEVRGVRFAPSGPYKIEYSEGATLRYYLRQLRLLHAAAYAAVYDKARLEKGRCRMTYRPSKDSQMLLCPSAVGSAVHLQRSHPDAEKVARNMGRVGHGEAPRVVTRKI